MDATDKAGAAARRGPGPGGEDGESHALRFAAVFHTLDEMDMLPTAIAHLRAIGVTMLYIFDFGSTDGTLDYLAEVEAAGDAWILHVRPEDELDELDEARVALARQAEADWVLFLDTDEMWLPATGLLRDIAGLEDNDVVQVSRYNVVLTPDGPAIPLDTPRPDLARVLLHAMPVADLSDFKSGRTDLGWIHSVQMPSVMARPEAIGAMDPGDHGVRAVDGQVLRRSHINDCIVAHVPFRSFDQFELKAVHAKTAVDAHPDDYNVSQGWQWFRWAGMVADGRLRDEYERQVTSRDELSRQLMTGEIRTAASVLSRTLPTFSSEEDFVRAVRRAQPWVTAAGTALRRHRIPTGPNLWMAKRGQYPTVLMNPDHVIKLYGPWKRGHGAKRIEAAALRLLSGDAALPVPRLIGEGRLDEDWEYIIESKIPGKALDEVRPTLTGEALLDVARWIGRFMGAMHGVDVAEDQLAQARGRFTAFIAGRHSNIRADLSAGAALPPHLIEQVEDWLIPLDELIGDNDVMVPLHADLHEEHVLGYGREDRFRPTGVIDFNRFRIGCPMYELGPMWNWLFYGDAVLLRTVVSEAGMADVDDPDFPRTALSWCLLHQGVAQFPATMPEIEGMKSLDELAHRTFGPASAGTNTR